MNPFDFLPKDMIKGVRDGNNRSTLSALRRRERAARIAADERPRNTVDAFNAASAREVDRIVEAARAKGLTNDTCEIRQLELHPTKGYRSWRVRL